MTTPEKTNDNAIEEQVFLEMDKFVQEHPGVNPLAYLQNFRLILPDPTFEGGLGGGKRYTSQQAGVWDKKPAEWVSKGEQCKYSQKRLAQADSDFFTQVDQAIKELRESGKLTVTDREISRLQANIRMCLNDENRYIYELYIKTLPVYIQLRSLGYNHYDLTS